jgi:hypothetical protein
VCERIRSSGTTSIGTGTDELRIKNLELSRSGGDPRRLVAGRRRVPDPCRVGHLSPGASGRHAFDRRRSPGRVRQRVRRARSRARIAVCAACRGGRGGRDEPSRARCDVGRAHPACVAVRRHACRAAPRRDGGPMARRDLRRRPPRALAGTAAPAEGRPIHARHRGRFPVTQGRAARPRPPGIASRPAAPRAVEARWGSLTEWDVFDRTPVVCAPGA